MFRTKPTFDVPPLSCHVASSWILVDTPDPTHRWTLSASMRAKPLWSCPTLCDPMDYSPPDSSVHGILQARTLEWVAIPSSRETSCPGDRTQVSCISCIGRQILYHSRHPGSPASCLPRLFLLQPLPWFPAHDRHSWSCWCKVVECKGGRGLNLTLPPKSHVGLTSNSFSFLV